MWRKKLKTVSAELMKSAPSGERGMNGKVFSGFLGAPPPACPRPSLPEAMTNEQLLESLKRSVATVEAVRAVLHPGKSFADAGG
jgi:hypothetical protein